MKKVTLPVFLLMCLVTALNCQTSPADWILKVNYGLQAHDKRLYDFPVKEPILARQPETFGTHQFGLQLQKKVVQKGKFDVYVGGGISAEVATFERPFDHSYKKNMVVDRVLRWTDRYYQFVFQLPVSGNFHLSDHFGLAIDVLPQFSFLTIAEHTNSYADNYAWWRFAPYSLEVNPGFFFTRSRVSVRLSYRAFQLKNIDEILFNGILRYEPKEGQTYETYNPFKVWLSVGYAIQGKGVKKDISPQ